MPLFPRTRNSWTRYAAPLSTGNPVSHQHDPPGNEPYADAQNRLLIRSATTADLLLTSALQRDFVPYGLFPQLGARFVRRWHATYLDSPFGIALVAERVDAIGARIPVGFLLGTTDQASHVAYVISRHRIGLGIAGLGALAVRPPLFWNFIRTRARAYLRRMLARSPTYASPKTTASSGVPDERPPESGAVAVITAIAVTRETRRTGVGRHLVKHFLHHAREAGAAGAELAAMADSSDVGRFYESEGWVAVEEHRSKDNAQVKTFRYNFAEDAGGSPN